MAVSVRAERFASSAQTSRVAAAFTLLREQPDTPGPQPRPVSYTHLEVVNAAGHEILAVQAHADGFFAGGEDEVGVEDVLGLHAGFLRQNVLQAAWRYPLHAPQANTNQYNQAA